MLQSLRIRNLALLEEVSLDFDSGFTVVTGETGAGKSVFLGALSLLAGERAEKTIVRQGASACEVEASLLFPDASRIDAALEALDLPRCEEGVLIIRRSIARDKPPRISVNGSLTTLAALQRLGEIWIDFHGPSEPRRLLKENCQLEMLDLYARDQELLRLYQDAYRTWKDLLAERERVVGAERLSADQIAYFERQIAELDQLDLTDEAIQTLERDFQRVSRAQELRELSGGIAAGLEGDEGIGGKLSGLIRIARQMEGIDPSCRPLADRLAALSVEFTDIAAECSRIDQDLQFSDEDAARIQQQMEIWLSAKRRHGGDPAAVARIKDDLKLRIASQGDIEGTLERLDNAIRQAKERAVQLAKKLRSARDKAARELSKITAKAIAALGFKKADFEIRITVLEDLAPAGDCGCLFLFSPNLGEPPLPLHRIASSGELARVMLALKTVLADLDAVPVLVFDEVDANVGGEIGRIVGEKMAVIARSHQVFCVTHLPQVASCGLRHFLVEKTQDKGRTTVSIEPLHGDRTARVQELARMLGDRNAQSARSHAEELLRVTASTG